MPTPITANVRTIVTRMRRASFKIALFYPFAFAFSLTSPLASSTEYSTLSQ